MKTESLSVDLLRIDAGTQSRSSINQEVVEDYAESISTSDGEWPFPPLDVFHDGVEGNYMMADGFHRLFAAKQAKRGSVPCNVHDGTAMDARIFSMTANDKHGLRMTRDEKRDCVVWLLDNYERMTQKGIAETAGVSRRLVQMIVADRNSDEKAQIAPSAGEKSSQQESGESKVKKTAATDDLSQPQENEDEPMPGIVGKTGRDLEVFNAQQCLKLWADTVGRWMSGRPAGIDNYREQFPGPLGDKVIEAAKVLFNAMTAWKKGLK